MAGFVEVGFAVVDVVVVVGVVAVVTVGGVVAWPTARVVWTLEGLFEPPWPDPLGSVRCV